MAISKDFVVKNGLQVGSSLQVNSTATFSNDVTISGNLIVSGTTTYVNTATLNIADNIVTLNADVSGATAPTENAGLEINRGSSANVQLRWNETTHSWEQSNAGLSVYYKLLANNDILDSLVSTSITVAASANSVKAAYDTAISQGSTAYSNATTYASNATNISSGTLNTARLPAQVNVSANLNIGAFGTTNGVNIQNTAIIVGNSTANATVAYNLLQASNATSTANLSPVDLKIGSAIVNSTVLTITTVNATTVNANTSGIHTGNVSATVINASANVNAPLVFANVTGTYANITGQVNTATFYAATSANVGGNVQITVSQYGITGNVTTAPTMSLTGSALTIGNSSITGAPSINLANSTGNTTVNVTSIGSSWGLISNASGVYHSGVVNAASHTTTTTVSNTTGFFPTTNAIALGNSIGLWVISANSLGANSITVTGGNLNAATVYATGLVNAANFTTTGTVNTATVYATGLVNAANFNTTGYVNTGTFTAATSANVGTALTINSIALAVTPNANFGSGKLFVDVVNSRVGINTTSPSVPFEVAGVGGSTYTAKFTAGGSGGPFVAMMSNTAAAVYNNLVQVNDSLLDFSNGTIDTGALVIGGWSSTSFGFRLQNVTKDISFTANSFAFNTGNTNFNSGKLFVDAVNGGATVGIGTTTPFSAAGYGWLTLNGTSGGILTNLVNGTENFRIQSWSGGTDINQITALPILFKTTNAERMRIDSAGRVGIGVTPSSYKLEVAATTYATASFSSTDATSTDIYIQNQNIADNWVLSRRSGGDAWSYLSGAHNQVWYTNAIERMRIDAGGNVAIGTTTTSGATLTVAGTVNAASYTVGTSFIANSTGVYTTGLANAANFVTTGTVNTGTVYATSLVNATSYNVGTSFIANSTAIVGTGYANVTTSVNSALLTVGTAFTANSTLVNAAALNVVNQINTATIYAATSIGIGTASPATDFEISNASTPTFRVTGDNSAAIIEHKSFSNTTSTAGYFRTTKGRGSKASPLAVSNSDIIGLLQFYGYYSSIAAAESFRISIGADAPTGSAFSSTTNAPSYMAFLTNIVGTGLTEAGRISASGAFLWSTTTAAMGSGNASNAGTAITSGGVISTAASGAASLNLNRLTSDGGVASFYRAGTLVGGISVTASATTYGTSSDYRLKDNVQPMYDALNTVSQLRPVTYDWKVNGEKSQGFIAHELAEIIPDAVTGIKDAVDENGTMLPQGVDYSKLVVFLTAAIQEQQSTIEDLKNRISVLENK